MTPESKPSNAPSPPVADLALNKAPARGFRQVARQISSRTTDLIAIAVVLIGGLTIGRQLIEWWRAEPEAVFPVAAEVETNPWGAAAAPVLLEFGDYPLAISRQSVSGDRETAVTTLVARCRSAAEAAGQPPLIVNEAAERLLARTATLVPAAEKPDVWRVYRLEEHFPLVLAVRQFPQGENDPAAPPWRLVCWGMAMPLTETANEGQEWTLYTFLASNATAVAGPDFALPPGSRRILGLRGESGEGLIAYSGTGNAEQWMIFFDRELERLGLSSGAGWQVGKSTWSARFAAEDGKRKGGIEVGFSRDATGALSGLIQVLP